MGSDLKEHTLLIVSRNSLLVLCIYITKVHGSMTGNPPQYPLLKQVSKFRTFIFCYNTIPPYATYSFKDARLLPSSFLYNTCLFIAHISIHFVCVSQLN